MGLLRQMSWSLLREVGVDYTDQEVAGESLSFPVVLERASDGSYLTLIAKSSKHENAKQPHWAQARSSCWGTRSPPL